MGLELSDLGPLRAERCDAAAPTGGLFAALRKADRPAVLDSSAGGRFTVVAVSPLARIEWRFGDNDPRAVLRDALAATRCSDSGPTPYGPGWIGCFGYGLRQAFERVPQRHLDETGIADIELSYYPAVAVHDNLDEGWWLLWREGAGNQRQALRSLLSARGAEVGPIETKSLKPRIDRSAYLAAVRRAVEYIYAGDIFQVNYAHEFSAPFTGEAVALYRALRDANPAPYCAYLDLGDGRAVLSTSPELFVQQRGRAVVTRPIKGTRPRGATPAEDKRLIAELQASEKDAAELAMIVDLERNDLGRVCEPGTVRVDAACEIESFASVHHRVATVTGQLEEGFDRVDVLAATFPGGSITGAPKVRAMQIIDELEESRRGPYTGSIGILTDEGSMEFNIAIRTAVLGGGFVRVHVGGGIVADSDPEAEYEETLAKGRAIFSALQG